MVNVSTTARGRQAILSHCALVYCPKSGVTAKSMPQKRAGAVKKERQQGDVLVGALLAHVGPAQGPSRARDSGAGSSASSASTLRVRGAVPLAPSFPRMPFAALQTPDVRNLEFKPFPTQQREPSRAPVLL